MSTQRRRVETVRTSLTPRQAVLAWLAEAHAHGSVLAYGRSLVGKPERAYPYIGIPDQVRAAARAAVRGAKPEAIARAERQVTQEVGFLLHLVWQANRTVLERTERLQLQLDLLVEPLRTLLHYDELAWRLGELRLELCTALPYPLDGETAAAVSAARLHTVETWDSLAELGMVADWVAEQYEREGHVRLPVGASLLVGDPEGMRWSALARPDAETVRACFADEVSHAAFVAGADYSYGLADVPDTAFEARYAAVEATLRALVEGGTVAAGAVVCLPTVPHGFLREAPLVDGVWIDAAVVALAEWGVLLARHGCVVRDPLDDHPLAWARLTPAKTGLCAPAAAGGAPARGPGDGEDAG